MKKGLIAAAAVTFILGGCVALAQDKSSIRILPWNGYKSSISLTFDDGDKSQIQTVVPALKERGMNATFYLIQTHFYSKKFWIDVAKGGNEIGNHSAKHLDPDNFTDKQVIDETITPQAKLAATYQTSVYTFAYPYLKITQALKDKLADTHLAARGGNGDYYMKPSSTPDWLDIPCQLTLTELPFDTYKGWIDTTVREGAWSVFLIHGIEGTDWGYSPIKKQTFYGILDYLKNPDIWVAPLGTVAAYWRAQKIIESSPQTVTSGGITSNWQVPSFFPKGTVLRVVLNGAGRSLYQGGAKLIPDAGGVYNLSFDIGSFEIK